MSKLRIDRRTLATFLKTPEAIGTFERLLTDVGAFPSSIEEAQALAASALTSAAAALDALASLAAEMERVAAAPSLADQIESDDIESRAELGTISSQDHDAIAITGGRIGLDPGAFNSPALYLGGDTTSGLYRPAANELAIAISGAHLVRLIASLIEVAGSIAVSQQLISTVAAGTPPLAVSSDTLVENLHVERAATTDEALHALTADYATTASTADGLSSPSSYPADATDLASAIDLVNALKAAAQSKGL